MGVTLVTRLLSKTTLNDVVAVLSSERAVTVTVVSSVLESLMLLSGRSISAFVAGFAGVTNVVICIVPFPGLNVPANLLMLWRRVILSPMSGGGYHQSLR